MKIKKDIRFYLLIVVIVWIASFFSIGKEGIGHYFINMLKPHAYAKEEELELQSVDSTEVNEKNTEGSIKEELSVEILSLEFVKYSFAKDEKSINSILSDNTSYVVSPDGSSFIRCTEGGQHVEGYMATDKILLAFKQKWIYAEEDEAITGMEIVLKEEKKPLIWYLHFKKVNGIWKLFMLENE